MEKLEETLRNNNIYMKLSLTVGALRPKLLPNYIGHQFQKDPSQYNKQPFSESRVQIDASVGLEFCSLTGGETDRQTHRQTALNI